MINIDQESEAKLFLDSFSNSRTRKYYRRGLVAFREWYNKTVKTILEERENDITRKEGESLTKLKFRAQRFERVLEKFHACMHANSHTSDRLGNSDSGKHLRTAYSRKKES